MRKFIILGLASFLGGCVTLQGDIAKLQQVYTIVTTATVPPSTIIITANAFDALKATAINYGTYCIQGKFIDPICSAANRRIVVKAIRTGTAVRNQLELSISSGTPASATLYNVLVSAVNSLSQSPALNNFRKGTQ
jgi:hypothetical protein